jgi:peptide/nickel transport system permease protein
MWLKNAVRGDFGDSWLFTVPVTQKFAEVIWYSFTLARGVCTELIIAIPLGSCRPKAI